MRKPPEWYRRIGKYGAWIALTTSLISLIVSIVVTSR